MDVPSGSALKRKIPNPVPLPLSLFTMGAPNENNPQSGKKIQPVKKVPELRPLKEFLSSAEYQFFLRCTKKPNQTETQVDNSATSKPVMEPKIRPSTITTNKLPRKELQTMSKNTKPKINYVQANKKVVKKIKTPKQIIKNQRSSSTNSKDSDKAFAFYEKLFNGYQPSPLTKLCNSLEVSILESTINVESINDTRDVIDSIKKLVHYEELRHRRFVTNITNLLQKLEDSVANKENNQIASSGIKNVVKTGSPLADLRQDIFHKNIAKKLVYNEDGVDDAKRQKAHELYSHFKEDCNFLCTPKPNSKLNANSLIRKSLSTRIQEQCLLLVDTPKH